MFKSFFNKINFTSQTIASAAAVIGALSLASRLVGILRDRILAAEFGAGDVLDVYYAAFRLPDLIYNLLVLGAVSAGFIPVFTALLSRGKKNDAWALTNGVLNFLILGLVIICGVLFLFAPIIVPLTVPGFSQEKIALTVNLSRIMFLSPIFLGLSAVLGSVLQSFKSFFIYSLAPIFYNVGIIIGALYFTGSMGIVGLAWGVVLGAFLHFIIQVPACFSFGFRYRPKLNAADESVRKVGKMTVPRTLTLAVNQINFLVLTIFASTLAAGSLAVFNFANNLQSFPLGIFGVPLAVAALPILSEIVAKKQITKFVETFSSTFRQILFFIAPISVLLYVLRAQVVRVVLGSGNFDWQDTRLTAAVLAIFALGLFAQGALPLLVRAFYSLHNGRTPFFIGLFSLGINVISLFVFRWALGFDNWFSFFTAAILKIADLWHLADLRVLALPAAISFSSVVNMILLMWYLRKKIGRLDGRKIISSTWRILFASLGCGLSAYGFLQFAVAYLELQTETFLGIFAQGFIAGLVGLAGFWLIGFLLNIEEMEIFISSIKRKMFKKAVITELGSAEEEI